MLLTKKNIYFYTFFYLITCGLMKLIESNPIPPGNNPMRVTIDYSQINKSYVNADQKKYIKTVFTLFSGLLSDLFRVKPRSGVIKNGGLLYCRDTYIGMDGIVGYKDTDFVIVVSATNTIFENFRARYNFCKWDKRPIMMEARYHMNYFKYNTVNFEVNEVMRAFMYNGMWNTDNLGWWINDTTDTYYSSTSDIYKQINVNGKQKWFMTGKYIKQAVQEHFNCPTALGLEVSNNNNYMQNFIPDDLFNNESIRDYENRKLSQFDIAIIKDMGVYEYVNESLVDQIVWGKNEGCAFLDTMCDQIYSQTKEVDTILYGCTQFKTTKYIKPVNEVKQLTSSGQCPRITLTNSVSCLNVTLSNSNTGFLGEIYGAQSKCFDSKVKSRSANSDPLFDNFIHKNSPIRCHYVNCNTKDMILSIHFTQKQKVQCKIPNEEIIVDTLDFFGTIQCPSDFSLYCGDNFCPNDCSGSGFCNNGVCICLEGKFGIDCSISCTNSNPDLCQCKSPCSKCQQKEDQCTECKQGYELVFGENRCVQICDVSCLSCSQPLDPKSCTECEFGFVLINGECIECLSPCKKCIEKRDQCTDCIENYFLKDAVCLPKCDISCKTCWLPFDEKSCSKCFDGYYLTEASTCEQCDYNCRLCSGQPQTCSDCYQNYYLDKNTLTCMPICAENCQTCSIPLDEYSCILCENGYFLKDGKCFNCIDSPNEYTDNQIPVECQGNVISGNNCGEYCKYCLVSSPTTCLECISQNSRPIPSCQCEQTYNFMNKKCQQCQDDEFFDKEKIKCQPCHKSCKSCFGASSLECSTCNSVAYQSYDYKIKQCVCIDETRSMVFDDVSETYECLLGMNVNFYSYSDPAQPPQYEQFQGKFTLQIQSSSADFEENIFSSFNFQISEIPSDSYLIKIEKYYADQIIFSIVQLKSFSADTLIITIKNNTLISSIDGRGIQQSQLHTQQMLQIGPLFIYKEDKDEKKTEDSINKALSFLSYNENIKNAITFLNQFSIFLYFLNTIQPSCLPILINTHLPPVFYSFQRIFAIFVFEDVPDQFVQRSQQCKMELLFSIDFCDQNASDPISEDKFERLGMSYSFPLNTAKVLNQYILFFIIFFVSTYILKLRQNFSLEKSFSFKNGFTIKEVTPKPLKIKNEEKNKLNYNKLTEIANKISSKSYELFYSTFEANILLISISAHLQLRAKFIKYEDQLLFRISIYSFSLFMIFLVYLMVSASKMIREQKLDEFLFDVKQDTNTFAKYFHYLNLIKKWIVCAAHVELYNHPLTLIIFVIAVYGIFLLLTAVYRPFKSIFANIHRVIGDSIFIFVYLCIYITHKKVTQMKNSNLVDQKIMSEYNMWGLIACYSLLSYNALYLILFITNTLSKMFSQCKRKSPPAQFLNILIYSEQSDIKNIQKEKHNEKKKKLITNQNNQIHQQQEFDHLDSILYNVHLTSESQAQNFDNKVNQYSIENDYNYSQQFSHIQSLQVPTQKKNNQKVIRQKLIRLNGGQQNQYINGQKQSIFGVQL